MHLLFIANFQLAMWSIRRKEEMTENVFPTHLLKLKFFEFFKILLIL